MLGIIMSIIIATSPLPSDGNTALLKEAALDYGLPIRYMESWEEIEQRTPDYLLVEVCETTAGPWSNGEEIREVPEEHTDGAMYWGGYDKNGYYTAYNEAVPEGTKVTSYIVYNPETTYIDDVVLVIDNEEQRP